VTEAGVLALAARVLERADVDPDADFFELGGDSLAAVELVDRLDEELGLIVDLADLFEAPNLGSFARDAVQAAPSAPAV
jgi:acyl carrier protein